MKIEELKDKLDDVTFASLKSYVDELIGQRDVAKRESIDQRKNLKAEVEQLRKVKADLFEKLGLDDDADIDTLPDAKGQADAIRQHEVKMKRLEREKADALKAHEDMAATYKKMRQDVEISKALGAQEFTHKEAAESLFSSRIQWDGDEIFYRTEKGMVPLAEGVKLFAEQNPSLVKAAGTAGSGQRGAGATQATDAETLAKAKAALIQQYSGVNP